MLFPCTPYEVVQFTVEKISFSGKYGLTIEELWEFIQLSFKQTESLDDFQKQTIWQWLFFENDDYDSEQESKLYVTYNNNPIPITLNYNTFIANYPDPENVRVLPQYEVQAFYLTGVSNNKMFFKALGEKPYELLQEIAKHGANGIWSPDLVDATGQDNRSLTARLKKLEDYNLIIKESAFYAKRKSHSNLIIHLKFAGSVGDTIDDGSSQDNQKKPKKKKAPVKSTGGGEGDEDGEANNDDADADEEEEDGGTRYYWRSRERVRNHIIEACKNAPHQIRVFRDLKRELRMHNSQVKSHFFTAITKFLHNEGIVEKVNIRDKETNKLIYALKFVKDPQDELIDNDESEFNGLNTQSDEKQQNGDTLDDDDDDDIETDENKSVVLFNNFFPLTVLTAQAVQESKDSGTTIKEIIRSLFGDSRHRMVERLFDVLPSYQLKGDALEHLNPFPEEDESTGIMRTCESEGKIKFYRFYMRDNYPQELKLKPAKKKRPINQVFKDGDLNKVEKRLRGKLNDRGKGPLVEVPKRLGSANILLHPERGETLPEVVEKPVEKATTPKVKKPRLGSLNKPQTKLVEKKTKKRKLPDELEDTDPIKGNDILSRIKRAARKPPIVIDDDYDDDEVVEEEEKEDVATEENKDEDYKEPEAEATEEDVEMKDVDEDDDELEVVEIKITNNVADTTDQLITNGDTSFNDDVSFNEETSFNSDTSFNEENGGTHIFISKKTRERSNKKKNTGLRERLFADSKSELRRNLIIEMTKEKGGVAYTSSEFLRELDARLGNTTTKSDRKTLTRDLARLQESGHLEVEVVHMQLSGQDVTRSLFYLTDEGLRPTKEQIDLAREDCKTDSSHSTTKQMPSHRTVESEYTLFAIDSPFKGRRLESLSKATSRGRPMGRPRKIRQEPPVKVPVEDDDALDTTTKKKTRSRKKKSKKIEDEFNERELAEIPEAIPIKIKPEPKAEVSSIVRKKLKRKTAPEKRSGKGRSKDGKNTVALKMDEEGAITLFRAVCISKAFIRNMIDFDSISEIFNNADVDSLRKSWSLLRRSIGGAEVINRGVKEFEKIVTKAIEEEDVDSSDLENIKYPFFLELWSRYEAEYEQILDVMPLYKNIEDNDKHYERIPVNLFTYETYDVYETQSMTTREMQLANTPFFEDNTENNNNDLLKVSPHKEHDDVRTVFKAVFGTSKLNGAPEQLDRLLRHHTTLVLRTVSEGMIRDKELVYYGDDNENNFVLTEKVYAALQVRIKSLFFNKAAQFRESLIPVINSNKGLILSQGISNGQMAQVLQLVSESCISLGRIDKNYDFEGYESRLLNKGFLDCEIVVYKPETCIPLEEDTRMTTSIPTGKVCSRIWLDVNGQIDSKLWRDILVAVLYHFHFRPGVTLELIFNKFDSLLSANDFNSVIEWLLENEFIRKGSFGGFYTTDNWLSVLGS